MASLRARAKGLAARYRAYLSTAGPGVTAAQRGRRRAEGVAVSASTGSPPNGGGTPRRIRGTT